MYARCFNQVAYGEHPASANRPIDGGVNLAILKAPMHRPLKKDPTLFARLVAALASCLLVALTVLAASPELHERLHGHPVAAAQALPAGGHHGGQASADDEDGCIVTLFAQGALLPVALFVLATTSLILHARNPGYVERIALESPRYLRLPAQGPPGSQV